MRVLVTGGAGYIGSHTVLQLRESGHFTVVYDNLSTGHKELVYSDQFVKGDIQNEILLMNTIQQYKIDAVMHFAAFIEAAESVSDPLKYFNNNLKGTINLLNCIIKSGVKYFIFSSTAALYGHPEKIPIDEESLLQPINPYGESKLLIEKILYWYTNTYDIKYISLRYFNAAGADFKTRTGELHYPESHLIPLAIQTAYKKREKLYIYGTDYNTPDGTCIRDYIDINDLAQAHILALHYLKEKKQSNIFNLGSEKGYSVKEVIEIVKTVTNIDFPVIETKRRKGDPDILIASSKKIKKILNWKPQTTDLYSIVESAVKWYKKHNKKELK